MQPALEKLQEGKCIPEKVFRPKIETLLVETQTQRWGTGYGLMRSAEKYSIRMKQALQATARGIEGYGKAESRTA